MLKNEWLDSSSQLELDSVIRIFAKTDDEITEEDDVQRHVAEATEFYKRMAEKGENASN
jgi:hypothetical protein